MKIIIARHADPDYEKDSLTEAGFIEAKSLAKRLSKIEANEVYVSPLGRAKATCREYEKISGKRAVEKEFLKEFNHAVYDSEIGQMNQPWDFMPKYYFSHSKLRDYDGWLDSECMKSGDIKTHYDKVTAEFDKLLALHGYERDKGFYLAKRPCNDTILLFCHFGIECVLLSHLASVPSLVFSQSFCCLPTGVTTVVTEEREQGIASMRCIGFGDLSHLYADGIEPSFSARFCEKFTDDTRH